MNVYHIRQDLRTKSIYDIDLRVAYYARVSTDKEEQKNSLKNQRKHFEDLIMSNSHWKLIDGYIDEGISGMMVKKREEFQHMISDAKAGKFDLILTKEISRFARNTLDSIQYTRELLRYGVCVWFQSDNINTIDEDSEFRLTIMAGMAQDEIRKLSNRVRFGHAQSIKNGVVLGNSHIYGYNKEKGRLSVNEDEANMVRLIFEKYASGEWTTPKLEKLLYDIGYTNYKGGKISRRVIQNIISNPKYKGWYAGGKVKIVDMFTKKQEFLPEEEWHMFKDDGERVPAIVSEEVWEQANRHLQERSNVIKSHRTSFKDGNLFTGKIYCANDGAAYWMKQHYVRGKEDVKWVCSHRIKNGAESCSSFGLSEYELKTMISDIIQIATPSMDEVVDKYIRIYEKVVIGNQDNSKELELLNKKKSSICAKKEKILDYNLSGSICDSEFLRRNKEYESQLNELDARIKELSKTPDSSDGIKDRLTHISSIIRSYSGIEADDINRSIVESLVDNIQVLPIGEHEARIEFFLRNGEQKSRFYHKNAVCRSGNVFNIMLSEQPTIDFTGNLREVIILPEQHRTFYRQLRSYDGHSMPVKYTYTLAI